MMLLLAPHHDDVLLSLPARLLAARRQGESSGLQVAIVFSEEDEALERLCDRLHAGLGVRVSKLRLLEARRRGERLREILYTRRDMTTIHSDPLVAIIAERVAAVANVTRSRDLITPFIAAHRDHALVRAAAERLSHSAGYPLFYYADQPYALLWPDHAPDADTRLELLPEGDEPTVAISLQEVEQLLTPLAPCIGPRTLQRILTRYRQSLRAEPLWGR